MMVEIQDISKTFYQGQSSHKALDNVSLAVAQGDIVGIIGASGAGKSTLIRMVNLLERPDSGKIIVNGVDLTALSQRELAKSRKRIGMIFQQFNLLSSRTVFGNVAFPLELDGWSAAKIKARVEELLEVVGLSDKADAYPAGLSGGQKQRVAIARALANDPYLLLCDEATSALDPHTTQSILQLPRDINKRIGITILLITHEMDVIKSICNYVAVIEQGKVIAQGGMGEVFQSKVDDDIKKFLISSNTDVPASLGEMRDAPAEGFFPLLDIELNGDLRLEQLVDWLQQEFALPYRIIKADVDSFGAASYGKILLQLRSEKAQSQVFLQYMKQSKINFQIVGYVQ